MSEYDSESIQALEELEGVRKRPAMYIGSTDKKGLHHLLYEVLDNSIDEALAGHCDSIEITLHDDNSVTVSDNGRGIPVEKHPEYEIPAVEVIMTKLHAGGKFDSNSYEISGGLHGVGVSVVNALSERLDIKIKRNGGIWEQTYLDGVPDTLEKTGEMDSNEESGTSIRFWPDSQYMDAEEFEFDTIRSRVKNLAYLNPGLEIILRDEESEEEKTFLYEGGIREFIRHLNEAKTPLHDDVMYFEGSDETKNGHHVEVEISMQYTDTTNSNVLAFANNIETKEGGTHLTGFKTAMTRIVRRYAEENNLLDDDISMKGEDVREGLTAIISVKHPDPQFEGQTKTKLGNRGVRGVVGGLLHEKFTTYLEQNPDVAQAIASKAVEAAKARQAAKKAEEMTRRKNALENTTLPGKLTDCQTRTPSEAELFVVEGDSAGGSARQGRDPEFQAVLPLKGKILNVERHRLDRILENTEIASLVRAIGAGVGDEFDVDDVRYENIIIMTDADVDGAHIRTLVLTLIYRYMRPLIEEGMVYAAQPPLYRVRCNGDTFDAMTEAERDEIVENECGGSPSSVQRFKGLGEMNPEQLWDAVMNPEKRRLKRITLEDAADADKMFSVLMGDAVQPRKEYIQENSEEANWVDI